MDECRDCDRLELLVYFVMSASSAILNALLRHDVIARRAGTLPLCLTALRDHVTIAAPTSNGHGQLILHGWGFRRTSLAEALKP